MGDVYAIRNNLTKRIYVGKAEESAESRWEDHLSGSRFHCLSLRKDMSMYGVDNFKFVVIEDGLFGEELKEAELWRIRVYNAADPRFGYNTMGKIPIADPEALKRYQAGLLKADPRRHRRYRQIETTPEAWRSSPQTEFAKNEASSVENDARFIAECTAKGLRLATKADIGVKVIYVWKTSSNDVHTDTLKTFGGTWAKIENDRPDICAKWKVDEIEIARGVIFVVGKER